MGASGPATAATFLEVVAKSVGSPHVRNDAMAILRIKPLNFSHECFVKVCKIWNLCLIEGACGRRPQSASLQKFGCRNNEIGQPDLPAKSLGLKHLIGIEDIDGNFDIP